MASGMKQGETEGRSQMTGLSATPEVESAAAKEQHYQDDDEKCVGVHESWMLAEPEHRIDSIDPRLEKP